MVEKLLNANEVATKLKIYRSKAYALMRDGSIEVVKFGRSIRVTEEALDSFINKNTIETDNFDITTKLPTTTITSLENLKSHSKMGVYND